MRGLLLLLLLAASASALDDGFVRLASQGPLRARSMFDAPREALRVAIARHMVSVLGDDAPSGEALRADSANTRVAFPKLTRRRGPTAVALSVNPKLCKGRDCALWIYHREAGEWAQLLDTRGYAFRVLETRSNTYLDVEILSETGVQHFRFDGSRYVAFPAD